MSNQGDDCYFYFYSTCTKGENCPFRHCNAALGNETVCTLWQEGRCFRQICKFRHMEIVKKRNAIPCFWENQLSGCQKGNCAFHHTKGRYVDGVYISPSKTQITKPEPSETTDQQISQTPSNLTAGSTTHLRGVKVEAAENVPSPTHPPVVINAADDDEDEDDQISEEGDGFKPSGQQSGHQGAWRVTTLQMDVLSKGADFGIKTLKEIKSDRKRVREESNDSAVSNQSALESSETSTVRQKNVTVIRTVMFSKNDPPNSYRNLAQRLGKRKVFSEESCLGGESFPAVKRKLSERLGKKIVSPITGPDSHPIKIQDPRFVKNRLGLPPEQNGTETEKAANPTTDFHIKTLQEIRQEKASQRQGQEATSLSIKSVDNFFLKSDHFINPQHDIHVKTLYEIQTEKKLRQINDEAQKDENKVVSNDSRVNRDLQTSQKFEDKTLMESNQKQGGQIGIIWKHICEKRGIKTSHFTDSVHSSVNTKRPLSFSLKQRRAMLRPVEQVQIKTLEEIRKEKVLQLQHHPQATNTEDLESVPEQQFKTSHKRILHLSKPQASIETGQNTSETNFKTNNAATTDTKPTVDFESSVLAPANITEEVDSDKTWKTQPSYFLDAQKMTQHEFGCAVEPSKIILDKKSKGKTKLNVEAHLMKRQSPAKAITKRKSQESSPMAEVKPPNTAITDTDKEMATVLLPVAESSVSQNLPVKKRLKESSVVPVSDPGYLGTAKTVVKSRRVSILSSGKPSPPTEDDFDELIWDISDGKLEDEIDLDPSKDEDALLMELSEMIDS